MSSRPRTVALAVALGLLLAAFGIVSSVWRLVLASGRPGAPVLGLVHHVGVLFLCARVVANALQVVLNLAVWRRARVARVVQLVWFGLGTVAAALGWTSSSAARAGVDVVGIVSVVVGATVLVLLWLPVSGRWFRDRSVGPAGPGL